MINHQEQWQKIQTAVASRRIPQAMLFVGPMHCDLASFVTQVAQLVFCKSGQPCFTCVNCQLVARQEYPDIEWVKPEKSGGAIKVDQIRELHNSAYLTPQKSNHKLIVIEAADRMNTASANALLKILEEPAQHTLFILIAQQLSTVLPTVISRCQIVHFSAKEDVTNDNLLYLGEQYPEGSERAAIFSQAEMILDSLIALHEGREHPCLVATRLNQFEPLTLFWFLHLVYSQIILMHSTKKTATGPAVAQLNRLVSLSTPVSMYQQLDKINTLLRKLSHNVNVNYTLSLEGLFL